MRFLLESNYTVYISSQVLREYLSIVTNKKIFERPLDVEEALSKVEEYENNYNVLYESQLSISILKRLVSKYRIRKKGIHDANIVATMITNQIEEIFSINVKDFEFYEEIRLYKNARN